LLYQGIDTRPLAIVQHLANLLSYASVAAAAAAAGAVYKYDLSMPTHNMYELVQLVRQRVAHIPGEYRYMAAFCVALDLYLTPAFGL
jgi:DNA-binding NarL/FixJ family response regulator